MTTTRPEVIFREPIDSSFSAELEKAGADFSNYTYTSLSCENCDQNDENLYELSFVVFAILCSAIGLLWFARKYIFKLHETSRN